MAECYSESEGTGRTYMYLFDKTHTDYECMGACHASELAYVFHNLSYNYLNGTPDAALADRMCAAWVNFAKTGDPSTDEVAWTVYDTAARNTMVISDDSSMRMVSDPRSEERVFSSCLGYVYFDGVNGI